MYELKPEDYRCKCGNCNFESLDYRLWIRWGHLVNKFHAKFGLDCKIVIHCVCRCYQHNKDVGGAERSQHLYAKAIDFHIEGVSGHDIAKLIEEEYPDNCGIGVYEWGVHFDARDTKGRW